LSDDALARWFTSGLVPDLMLAFMALEAVALVALRRRRSRGPSLSAILANICAGVTLTLAVRAALTARPTYEVGLWLVLSLPTHLADLRLRWRDDDVARAAR
jgi:hypothetical protein